MRHFASSASIAAAAVLLTIGCADQTPLESAAELAPIDRSPAAVVGTDTLDAVKDTWIRFDGVHRNYGSSDTLRVRALNGGNQRSLVGFDTAAIAAAVGGDSVVSASLVLQVNETMYWESGGDTLRVHRMTQPWTEGGATWACADDSNIADNDADCPTAAWTMNAAGTHPYQDSPTDVVLVTNGISTSPVVVCQQGTSPRVTRY